MKKHKIGELANKVISYAKDKSTTREPWLCCHELASFLRIPETSASEVLSRLQRKGLYGKKVLEKLSNKSDCKFNKRLHVLYTYAGKQRETPKGEATIPVSNETVKRLGEYATKEDSYNTVIMKMLNQVRASDVTVGSLKTYIKKIEVERDKYKVAWEQVKSDNRELKRKMLSPTLKDSKLINDLTTQMATLVKEYGKVKTALKKQKDINKILVEYLG